MDDIHIDNPRYSAKKRKASMAKIRKNRTFLQYLFDIFVKTLILATVISIDFTLFLNAGNYSLFTSGFMITFEAQVIYAAILSISFIIMFICSFFRKLENIIIAVTVALTTIVIINQFATFDKQSGLLILVKDFLPEDIKVILYEYSYLIIGAIIFLVTWIYLCVIKRAMMFYSMMFIMAILAWILSESYLNTSIRYFKTVASSPVLRSENAGKNLVFLSFNSLTSPNNIRSMYINSRQQPNIQTTLNNVLGFYNHNKFTLYPNAIVKDSGNPFFNLISAYNPDSEQDASTFVLTSAVRDDYFDFDMLQSNKFFLKDSSLYNMLRKDDYTIHVFQTRDIDTCYLDNKLAASSCKEKINTPIPLSGNQFSIMEKIVLLTAQWLSSTGFVPTINPILQIVDIVYSDPALKPLNFEIDNLYSVNSFKVLDQIVESIDNHNGNQAYFAIIDLPSETYVYDEFCQMKPMSKWVSEKNSTVTRVSTDTKRIAYAEQVSCLYGYLEKFIQQLDKSALLDNTTIVIEGLNTPQGLGKIEQDYYRQLQNRSQVMLAIRPAKAKSAKIDYKVCLVNDILNSFFFTNKPCEELKDVKMSYKDMELIHDQIKQDKYKDDTIKNATDSFKEWFMAWTAQNQFQSNFTVKIPSAQKLKEAPIADIDILETPEQDLKSIKAVAEELLEQEEDDIKQTPPAPKQPVIPEKSAPKAGEDVIPETILDNEKKTQPDAKVFIQDDAVRDILEAPVASGQNLSPEELKKQYHQNLQQIAPQTEENISIKVNLIEN